MTRRRRGAAGCIVRESSGNPGATVTTSGRTAMPGAVSVTICRIEVDFCCTTTPCACTGCGSEAVALATRFCTSTCAKLRSVPMSKVTVST